MLLALLYPLWSIAADPARVAPLPTLPPAAAVPAAPPAAPTVLAGPPAPSACEKAGFQLLLFTKGLNVICARDTDCVARAVDSDPCAPLVLVNKNAIGLESSELKLRQKKATEACKEEWAKRPSCIKGKVLPVCREGKCADGGLLPGSVK